jgi:hypothetical protein
VGMVLLLAGSGLAASCCLASNNGMMYPSAPLEHSTRLAYSAPLPLPTSSVSGMFAPLLPAAYSASELCPANYTAASWTAHCGNATTAAMDAQGCAAAGMLVSVGEVAAAAAAAAEGVSVWNITRNASQPAAAAAPAQQCAMFAPLLAQCPRGTRTAADVTCRWTQSLQWHVAHHTKQQQQQQAVQQQQASRGSCTAALRTVVDMASFTLSAALHVSILPGCTRTVYIVILCLCGIGLISSLYPICSAHEPHTQ